MSHLKIWNLFSCDHDIHIPLAMLTEHSFVRVFNHLPTYIKSIANETKVCKKTLKRSLLDN
jgi:hypothetical protein